MFQRSYSEYSNTRDKTLWQEPHPSNMREPGEFYRRELEKVFFEESKLLCMGGREKGGGGGSMSCIQFYFADKVNQNLNYVKVCSKLAKNQISKYFNLSEM